MPNYTQVTPDDIKDDAGRIDFDQLSPGDHLVVPDGDHELTGSASIPSAGLKITAADGASPTLSPRAGYNEFCINHSGADLVWRDVDIDVSDGVTGIRCRAPSFEFADFEFLGRGTTGDDETVGCFSVNATDGGEGIIRNVTAAKGSTWARYKGGNGRIFAWVGGANTGTIRFEDCRAEEFGNNGIYGSESPGRIVVEGCEFWNNNVSGVRFGADGCEVRNTTIGVDVDRYTGPREPEFEAGDFYHRGVWVESKKTGSDSPGRVTVVDSHVDIRNTPSPGAAIQVRPNACGLRVQRSDIHATETPALHGKRPEAVGNSRITHHPPDPPHDIRVTRSRLVTDEGADAVDVTGRDVDIRDCCIQGAGDRRGVRCRDAEGSVTSGRIVAGTPTEGVRAEGIQTTGSCDGWSPGDPFDAPVKTSPAAGIDPTDDSDPDAAYRRKQLRPMELHIKTDSSGNGGVDYRIELADDADARVLDDPTGDSYEDGVISGTVWSSGADGYEVVGEITGYEAPGPGGDGLYAVVDGERVEMDDLADRSTMRAVGDLAGAVSEKLARFNDGEGDSGN